MKQGIFEIIENRPVNAAGNVFRMTLAGDAGAVAAPGQFVGILVPGKFLRRPISVCDWTESSLTLIYKTVGEGTAQLSRMAAGQTLDLLTGLGSGYSVDACGDHPLLIGGGVGIPPLYGLAKALLRARKKPRAILGFNTKEDIFLKDEFEALGVPVLLTTADGSAGRRGFVTDALPAAFSYVYACGPLPMLKAVYRASRQCGGQFSLEERMGCGFGACMGCSIQTAAGAKRVCKDGPVFRKEELLWDD